MLLLINLNTILSGWVFWPLLIVMTPQVELHIWKWLVLNTNLFEARISLSFLFCMLLSWMFTMRKAHPMYLCNILFTSLRWRVTKNTIPFIITHHHHHHHHQALGQILPTDNSSRHACSNSIVAWHKPFYLSFPTMTPKAPSIIRVLVVQKVRNHSLLQLLPLVHLRRALV